MRAEGERVDALVKEVADALRAANDLRYSMTSVNSVALGKALPKAYFALARLAYPSDLIPPQPPLARDPEWPAQEC